MRPNSPYPIVVRPHSGPLTLDSVRSLHQRPARDAHGLFLAEGTRFLASGTDAGAPLAGLVVCRRHLTCPTAHAILARARDAPILELTPDEYARVSLAPDDGERRQKVLAVFHQTWAPLPDRVSPHDLWLGVESVRNPGNLGTLLRSAESAGAGGLLVFDHGPTAADPFDPAVVRASMGSIFAHRIVRTSHAAFRRWRGRSELSVVGACPEAPTDYRTLSYRRATVLMLGDERTGLSEGQRNSCDRLARIPMRGQADSLNLAMAGTLMLFEAFHHRHPAKGRRERG